MARFHFHLRTERGLDEDEFGLDFPNLQIARQEAVLAARAIAAETVLAGEAPLSRCFEITDGTGRHLLSVPFGEAVRLS